MPRGTCDPSPEPFNVVELSKGGGEVTITIRWEWDGVSVWPNCAGSVVDLRVRNAGANTWACTLPRANGGGRTVTIDPGADTTFGRSGPQHRRLSGLGLDVIATIAGLTLRRA